MILDSFHCGGTSSLSGIVQISLWISEHYVLPPLELVLWEFYPEQNQAWLQMVHLYTFCYIIKLYVFNSSVSIEILLLSANKLAFVSHI